MSDAFNSRLLNVVQRLEALAGGAGGEGSDQKQPAFVEEYDAIHNGIVAQFIATCRKVEATHSIAAGAETAFNNMRQAIHALAVCKKPSDQELLAFLAPLVEVVKNAQNTDNRSPVFNHLKAWAETSQLFNWMFSPTPTMAVESTLEASDFYLNKVLAQAKNEADAAKAAAYKDYRNQTRTMVEQLTAYVRSNHKMGPSWNPKGKPLSDFKSSGAPAAPQAPEAPEAPPAPEAPEAPAAPDAPDAPAAPAGAAESSSVGGLGAVFAQINAKGEGGVTAGLRHVTKDMKTKNQPKDALPPAPKAAAAAPAPVKVPGGVSVGSLLSKFGGAAHKPAEPAHAAHGHAHAHAAPAHKAAPAAPVVAKKAVLELRKGTWFVEHYDGKNEELKDVQMKQNVYIMKCNNATITIGGKVKSIQIESCTNTTVVFDAVVSTAEVVNSKKCKLYCKEYCPAVAVDKSAGIAIVLLTEEALKEVPKIVTSMTTELNLVVPGKSKDDDPVEIPLSEQFQHVYDRASGKVLCEPVKHSAA